MLKYDSLYQSLKKVSAEWHAGQVQWEYSWYYIKFFRDSTFIYSSISGDNFDQINGWFTKGAENVISGSFEMKSAHQFLLKFSETNIVSAEIVKDGKLLIQGLHAWEIFSPIV